MRFLSIISVGVALLVGGCTSIQVQPLDASTTLENVCIEKNEKVIVPNFLNVVRQGFTRHGIITKVYESDLPANCEFMLTYTALRSWDFATYLSHAELWLHTKNSRQVAYAEYHLNGGGGLALNKWASTESKMNPVLDKLLVNYK
ncbi:Sbal_3080 family lipoprotein [Vreelandella subglaciescola]|uniref:Lipoprotein n=1 Tax=Vreelandella subglaciescola TaxID=29571 RepID=A0A1M7I729_9GAMM|nr:Sbal_3080 family lipoprotein [Halomonas subglaciescola]SHM36458.1 hypothetical protein SAMN05878437_2590 [Halomonas subglaciescola]